MEGKIVIVTGANAGMGLATTIELAKLGATVIMACRDKERGKKALQVAQEESGSQHIHLMTCDLGSFQSIRTFVEEFKVAHSHLDVLINNAGVVTIKRTVTPEGHEAMMGVNHLGHFLLTNLLLDWLARADHGRVVVLSSGAHKAGRIHFEDPNLTKSFNVMKGYAQSKLANTLFTKELAERLKGTGITVNSVHPGGVSTSLGVDRKSGFGKTIHSLLRPFFLTPAQGAETAVYLATSPEVIEVSGEYFYKKKVAPVAKQAKDNQAAKKLWVWSEEETGLLRS
ncbi:SDR family oxidoreductase [Bacillus horti]|uniref:NAD(P)-dependent dehydrogenase (Short-subunit alcohol dehydrogenase family) n=1 Tax=Caldalkalibacillus horti TaxID=77523 RepID=A0ABT9VY88_9BACI|nr:SDR family oxidoreductase [Bacillus horti]MDQ0165955.1 NAD(P)-dependent dehydrogenase (short-subunit alcohol dehydrogenase family) [Bacillus horti]